MPLDLTYPEQNRASTDRMRALAARLTDAQLLTAVGQHWTVAIVFAHIMFWDRRVQYVLDMTERDRQLFIPEIDIFVNDLSLPLWAAIPPRTATEIAIAEAEALDRRLAAYPRDLLEVIYDYNRRWVIRGLHRHQHLDEADAGLMAVGL